MISCEIPLAHFYQKNELIEALKTVIDPELYVNIVDLGLVYAVSLNESSKIIYIEMTLSAKFCPMGESILSAVKNCVERSFKDFTADVRLVWEPQWNYSFISPKGLNELNGY